MRGKYQALLAVGAAAVIAGSAFAVTAAKTTKKPVESTCITCHTKSTPVIVAQWRESDHAKMGVECDSCHSVGKDEPGARKHFNGTFVIPSISPKVCGQCHDQQEKEFTASHHASGAKFIGSLDNVLGEVVEGGPAAAVGCKQCHGSTLRVGEDGRLDPDTWPNSGIGRINLDGSNGACSACHARHTFSITQAREPETCGRCHLGPDHPQNEIYNESKHGILFRANRSKMNMGKRPWVVGKDYSAAPVCATCHMSATPKQPLTHDIGTRISWTLRPVISTKLENWETRRKSMQETCRQCHSPAYVTSFYKQFDAAVNLYNDKFARPAKEIIDKLRAENLLTDTPFDEKLEWTYYLLWHHEGRRARHGASMMGADYAQWHGFFDVADRFYNEFLPEVEHLKPDLARAVLDRDEHKWKQGLPKEEREKILQYYKERYGQ
jgi:hydroxylamine dehydrogenase